MFSDYDTSSADEYRLTAILLSLEQKLLPAFKKYVAPEEYPDHMNVLGAYLLVQYNAIHKELKRRRVSIPYSIHQYMTPLYALPYFYRDLTMHVGELCKVPTIFERFDEIICMVDRCISPKAIYPSDQLCKPS